MSSGNENEEDYLLYNGLCWLVRKWYDQFVLSTKAWCFIFLFIIITLLLYCFLETRVKNPHKHITEYIYFV